MPPARQARAKRYARIRRALFFADQVINAAGILFLLVSGLSVWLREQAEGITANDFGVVALYVVALGVAYSLVSLPLGLYSSYILPRRFGLTHQTFGAWVADQAKGLAISGPLVLVMVEAIYLGLRLAPDTWWLWATAAGILLSLLMLWLVPVVISPLFNRFTPLENADVRQRLLRLADTAGVRVQGVFVMDFSRRTSAANAYVTGIGNTHRIVLADTLLQNYTPDEIESVMAHEMGHYVKHDTWRLFVTSGIFIGVALCLANTVLHAGAALFGLRGVGDIAGLPLFGLVFALFSLLTLPLFNAYSRRIEHAADVYELETAHNPAAFISAMRKLQNQNLGEADPPAWAVLLFYSHPPVAARIRFAEDYARHRDVSKADGL